ncbi:hypothetical protein ABFS82_01G042600 [Erythranthe guttata]|nr:PREDICTED: protein FAM32A-like isoform X2 [Erythranthe guttata]|eukprot:XP_012855973.1 PREDICTED: protein FAM32A-like isoform X2 [Erythranthe guttata]
MSAYENVVAGKLRLKGRALDVRDAAIKKKKKNKNRYFPLHDQLTDGNNELVSNQANEGEFGEENERLTPAERRYMEQCQRIELQRLAKTAKKSHRDRIQEFNNYLANLTEHYDIPKVGPG